MIDKAHAYWSVGTYFFWPIFVIGVLLLIAGILGSVFARETDWLWVGCSPGLVLAVAAVFFYWPVFDSSFHKWYPVNGTVTSTSSRLLTDGGSNGLNQRIVIGFAESGQLFGCDDSRCTAAKVGDRLNLKCKKHWQLQGTPGWVCVYVDGS